MRFLINSCANMWGRFQAVFSE